MRQLVLLIGFLLIFDAVLCADSSFTRKVDRYLQPYLQMQDSSGIPSYDAIPEYEDLKVKPVHLDDLIAIMRKKPLDFEPGSTSSYSNTGYAFLAYTIEKVSGKSYGEFIADEIFRPLGMKASGTFSDTALITDRAGGYQPWTGGQKPEKRSFLPQNDNHRLWIALLNRR